MPERLNHGRRLSINGPEAAVTELLPALQAPKAALLALLRAGRLGSITGTPQAACRCHGCCRYFPEAQLTVVQEERGRGFRCPECLSEK